MNREQFYQWERASRDTIDVKRCYIDVVGDLVAGILLSQIIYWFLPSNGRSKLKIKRDGEEWLAKKRTDWWAECRITSKQYIRAIGILTKKGLVTTKVAKFNGVPTVHILLNAGELIKQLEPIIAQGNNGLLPFGTIENAQKDESITKNTDREYFIPTATNEDLVFQFFQNNIHKITPYVREQLVCLIETHGSETVLDAVREAIHYNHGNLAYVTSILMHWQANGGKTPKPRKGYRNNTTRKKRPVSHDKEEFTWPETVAGADEDTNGNWIEE